jgi:hypothetical protein
VYRFDRANTYKLKLREDGTLAGHGVVSRCGVFPYRRNGKIIRELRHPDDVFEQASLDSLKLKSVTLDHPSSGFLRADADNSSRVGVVGETITRDGEFVVASLAITSADVIRKLYGKERADISPGYVCDVVEESGVYNGQQYDARQKNIRYNHLSLPDTGRQGKEVGIRVDGAEDNNIAFEVMMKKVRCDGVDFELEDQAADLIVKEQTKTQQMSNDLAKLQGRFDAIDAELKSLQSSQVDVDKVIDERLSLREKLNKLLPEGYSVKGKSAHAIRCDALSSHDKTLDLSSASEAYVEGRLDAVLAMGSQTPVVDNQRSTVDTGLDLKAINEAKRLAQRGK